eukprot:443512-Alexandrium_andersonii.AAC.1
MDGRGRAPETFATMAHCSRCPTNLHPLDLPCPSTRAPATSPFAMLLYPARLAMSARVAQPKCPTPLGGEEGGCAEGT